MRLGAVTVTNFKAFAGEHQISFPDRGPDRPVYLIGGLNGTGKTSLTHAVAVALHGERAAGLPALFRAGRDARKHYERWLRDAFNRHAQQAGADQMSASVQLTDATTTITVTRSWWFDVAGGFDEEHLEAREDARSGESTLLAGEAAQQLIDELLPRHLLDFAIFDAEQLRRLDDTLSAAAVRTALDRLLNLDSVERVRTELARITTERRLAQADPGQQQAYEALRRRLSATRTDRSRLTEQLGQAEVEHERLQHELDQLAGTLDTALATATPGQITGDLITLRERRSSLRARISRHLSDWLYLWPALGDLPHLIDDVQAQRDLRTGRERLKLRREAVDTLVDQLTTDRALRRRVGGPALTEIRSWLQGVADERQHDLDATIVHAQQLPLADFTDAELDDIDAAASAGLRDLTDVAELAVDLRRVDQRISELEALLATADRSSTTAQLLRRRDELHILLGEQRATGDQLRGELDNVDTAIASLRSQLTRLEQRLTITDTDRQWVETAEATVAALDAFVAEARAEASQQVQSRMLRNLRVLFRKDHLVHDVHIDPTTHVTRLLDGDGRDVALPSAGEHQLAAMAFIDAVLAAAHNPLPVFVDTPLARLDSHHRRTVVCDFWPALGRQVIVLSTDEEVVDELLTLAAPSLAGTYRLDCDDTGRSTITSREYLQEVAS